MSMFDIFKKPFKDVHDGIKSYDKLYKKAAMSIDAFDSNKEIKKNKYSDSIFINELKQHYLNMCESGLDIDHLIEIHVKNGKNKSKLAQFSTKLQRHSVLELTADLLSNKDIDIVSIPDMENKDIFSYANRLHSIFKEHEETLIRIKQLNLIIEKADEKILRIDTFKHCLALNISNLNTYKLEFARELKNTKSQLDRTMNFIPLPNQLNEETIRFHAYIRKLIDLNIFSKDHVFKLYTDNIPTVLLPFEDKIGYFNLTKEQVGIVLESKTEKQTA